MKSFATILILSVLSIGCGKEPAYTYLGMTIYLSDSGKGATKEEFVVATNHYIKQFANKYSLSVASLVDILDGYEVEFIDDLVSVNGNRPTIGAHSSSSGSILLTWNKCMTDSAYSHELGHAFSVKILGKKDSSHANTEYWIFASTVKFTFEPTVLRYCAEAHGE